MRLNISKLLRVPTKLNDFISNLVLLLTTVWALSLLSSAIGLTLFEPTSSFAFSLKGLLSAALTYVGIVLVLFVTPLAILFYAGTSRKPTEQSNSLIDYIIIAAVALVSIYLLLGGNLLGVLGLLIALLYGVFGLRSPKTKPSAIKSSIRLRYAAYFAGFSLIPIVWITAQTSRFSELSSNCDACGDAYLGYIYYLPLQIIICIVAGIIGAVVASRKV